MSEQKLVEKEITARLSEDKGTMLLSVKFSALSKDGYLVTAEKYDAPVSKPLVAEYSQANVDALIADIDDTFGAIMDKHFTAVVGARMADEFRKVAAGDTSGVVPNEHDIAMQEDFGPIIQELVQQKMYSFDLNMDTVVADKPYTPKP